MLNQKFELRRQFENHLRRLLPNCDLFIFGSSASGFGSSSSDMDMCLVTNSAIYVKDVKLLWRIKDLLGRNFPLKQLEVIPAKVPILKFVHQPTKIHCELSMNDSAGVRNTHLLKFFTKCDSRFVPLVLAIKRWARHHKINDASQGTLSSYALTLMALHFLQCGVQPPVLPNLIKDNPDVFHGRRPLQSLSFFDPVKGLEPPSSNDATVGELFVGFLAFYARDFQYSHYGISVREATPIPKRTDREFSKFIFIEEPYNGDNVARAVRKVLEPYIKQVIDRSYEFILDSKTFESVFDLKLNPGSNVPNLMGGDRAAREREERAAREHDRKSEGVNPTLSGLGERKERKAKQDAQVKIQEEIAKDGKGPQSSDEEVLFVKEEKPSTSSLQNSLPEIIPLMSQKSEISELYELASKRKIIVNFEPAIEGGDKYERTFTTKCTVILKKERNEIMLAATAIATSKKLSKALAAQKMMAILQEKKVDVAAKETFP